MNNITYGPAIEAGSVGYPVQGKRPAWLALDDKIDVTFESSSIGWRGESGGIKFACIEAFKLPADHWAYVPIAAGFTPWAGGDTAPADWDGTPCMLAGGAINPNEKASCYEWRHNMPTAINIIGYKRKPLMPSFADGEGHAYCSARRLYEALCKRAGITGDAEGTISTIIDQIDHITATAYEPRGTADDWHNGNHVPTVRACIEALSKAYQPGAVALEKLLPPDPFTERAKQLHAAAREAWAIGEPPPGVPVMGDWDALSDPLRKFWIAMARIDGQC